MSPAATFLFACFDWVVTLNQVREDPADKVYYSCITEELKNCEGIIAEHILSEIHEIMERVLKLRCNGRIHYPIEQRYFQELDTIKEKK